MMSVAQEDQMSEVTQEDAEINTERYEEMKLKQKYPNLGTNTQFLQKRIQQHKKYFDSGDYNMAKAKGLLKLPALAQQKQQLPVELIQAPVAAVENDGESGPVGTTIPTPENVPIRKTSLIQPDVGSKLSPQPHLSHAAPLSPVSPVHQPTRLFPD